MSCKTSPRMAFHTPGTFFVYCDHTLTHLRHSKEAANSIACAATKAAIIRVEKTGKRPGTSWYLLRGCSGDSDADSRRKTEKRQEGRETEASPELF